jgi:ferredoxin-NADP reductase
MSAWRLAEVVRTEPRTPRVKSLFLRVPDWPGHRAGQHVDVRLTAADGYQAVRSYSLACAPGDPLVELAVERLEGGEVSPYLTEEVRAGDRLEIHGPLGGYFVWGAADGGPLFLAAGGSGVVPLRAMARVAAQGGIPFRLLYSSRTHEEVIFREEWEGRDVRLTLTRQQPPDWQGYRRRVDMAMLAEVAWPPEQEPRCYVCGPNGFVEAVADALAALGHAPERILTERFGPTGV